MQAVKTIFLTLVAILLLAMLALGCHHEAREATREGPDQ